MTMHEASSAKAGGTGTSSEAPPASVPWLTRPASLQDLGYVWLSLSEQFMNRPLRWHETPGQRLSLNLIRRRERTVARYLLREARCTVAAPIESPELVCGFIVFDNETETVHYLYTPRAFRNMGIARSLFTATVNGWPNPTASHQTKDGCRFLAKLGWGVRFDPYRAFIARDYFLRDHDGSEPNAEPSARPTAGPDTAAAGEG